MAQEEDSSFTVKSQELLHDIYELIIKYIFINGTNRNTKVVEFIFPDELKTLVDMNVSDNGVENDSLLEVCQKVVHYSVRMLHPRNFDMLYSGFNSAAMAGAWITESLNANMHTFEVAPVFILIDNFIIQELCKLVGFCNGEGLFVPGSSFGNFMAIHLARYFQCKDVKAKGLFGMTRSCIFISDNAHYSTKKAAHFLGFGTDSIIYVESVSGVMKPDVLEKEIANCQKLGKKPLLVLATCGTTVLGAFDLLSDLAIVCKRHDVWLHADCAWGGGALFSQQHKHLLNGLEHCNSMVWSLHKVMGAQIQCSVILLKQKGYLKECNSAGASYLFQPDKFYDVSYDTGDQTVQCGRKADSFKFWLMWKSMGHSGMAKRINCLFENARYFTEELKSFSGFRIVQPAFQYLNICFWYIPIRMRQQKETEEWWINLGKVAPKIKEGMTLVGSMLISYQPLESMGFVNFFRFVSTNPNTSKADLNFILHEIARIGYRL